MADQGMRPAWRCETCRFVCYGDADTDNDEEWLCDLLGSRERGVDTTIPFPETLAHATASEGPEYAWLVVSPDFGCVQWEPKE